MSGMQTARLAVRLVSADGDVLWSTTKESKGASTRERLLRADEVVKQLMHDLEN